MGETQGMFKINQHSTAADNSSIGGEGANTRFALKTELNSLSESINEEINDLIDRIDKAATNEDIASLENIYAKMKHSHAMTDVTGLAEALEDYVQTSDLDTLKTSIDKIKKDYALTTHKHTASEIEDLETFVQDVINTAVIPETDKSAEEIRTFYDSILGNDNTDTDESIG